MRASDPWTNQATDEAALLLRGVADSRHGRRRTHLPPLRRSRSVTLVRVDLLDGQKVVVDLAERDRERLLLDGGVDQRADVLEQALAELRVVRVDLTSALGRVQDELVLGVGLLQKVVDRGVGDA